RADGAADLPPTVALRARRLADGPTEPPEFTFGAARDAYRRQWPMALEDALANAIADQPAVLRQFLHHELKRLIGDRLARGEIVEPGGLDALVAEVGQRLSAGYPAPETVSPPARPRGR